MSLVARVFSRVRVTVHGEQRIVGFHLNFCVTVHAWYCSRRATPFSFSASISIFIFC